MLKKISISIPLKGEFLLQTENLLKKIEKKFSINLYNTDCRPHINLCSGTTTKLFDLKKKLNFKLKKIKKEKIYFIGTGIFLMKKPTIYQRFILRENILNFRKKCLLMPNIWNSLDKTAKEIIWIPKSTLINKKISVDKKKFQMLLTFLNSWNFKIKSFYIKEICLIDFTKNETEIESFRL